MAVPDLDPTISTLAGAAGAVGAAGAAASKLGELLSGRRQHLKLDLEILDALPESSAVRSELLQYIEAEIRVLIVERTTKRRDWGEVSLGVAFIALAILIASAVSDGWTYLLWLPVGFCGLMGAVGIWQGAVPRLRDERGRPIKNTRRTG